MNPQKLTEQDYQNLEVTFAALRKDQFANENAVIEAINLKAKVIANLKDYDNLLAEREKPASDKINVKEDKS